jgi:hypothetical protein
MRAFTLAAAFGVALLGFAAAGTAQAHGPGGFYGGYGNGLHDFLPHWHRTLTPFGPTYWYGNGLHDYLPHHHSVSPWGGVRSYSFTPFGPTKSYNGFPYSGGYYGGGLYGGSYYGGYAPYSGGYYGGYAPYYGGYYGGWGW